MQNIKVLMADDEPDILQTMSKKVAAQGYDVVTAQDGEEAWEKIQNEIPDVIVLDLTMPKMDGFEVLKMVRENPVSDKWQPVIIVSARSELEDMQKSYSLEADHYISKPCRLDDILKAITLMVNLISKRKSSAEILSERDGV